FRTQGRNVRTATVHTTLFGNLRASTNIGAGVGIRGLEFEWRFGVGLASDSEFISHHSSFPLSDSILHPSSFILHPFLHCPPPVVSDDAARPKRAPSSRCRSMKAPTASIGVYCRMM